VTIHQDDAAAPADAAAIRVQIADQARDYGLALALLASEHPDRLAWAEALVWFLPTVLDCTGS
jgi:hypothetical protein